MIQHKIGDLIKYYNRLNNKENVYILHCISNDWKLGAGVALSLKLAYQIKKPFYDTHVGECVFYFPDHIGNLITKSRYFYKPTLNSLKASLNNAKKKIPKGSTILMPKIGCGLDKLNWEEVEPIVEEILGSFDVIVFSLD